MNAIRDNSVPGPDPQRRGREVRILSIGRDQQLLLWRNNLLRSHGYLVTDARTASDAMAALGKPHDIVLFGHAVPETERNQIAATTRQTQPRAKIIMLYLGTIRRAEMADALLSASGKPDDLLHTIELLLAEKNGASKHRLRIGRLRPSLGRRMAESATRFFAPAQLFPLRDISSCDLRGRHRKTS